MDAFGRYQLIRRLGAGGMGEVFLARGPERMGEVVLKRVLPRLTENPRFLRLLLDETRIASRLDHPNIARILDLGEVAGSWFIAMEFVDGKDLRELLKRTREHEGQVPIEVCVAIAIEVAKGLVHAHGAVDSHGRSLRIVHRDVSPHNVLVGRNGTVKLIDFGVAKAANKSVHTGEGMLKGKFPYMAPEQALAKPVDPRTDVFALGIVLWEMVTARHLFRGSSDAATLKLVRDANVPIPSTIRASVPEALDALILKALQRWPKSRFVNASAMLEALEGIAANLPTPDVAGWMRELDDVPGLDDDDFEDEFDSDARAPFRPGEGTEASVHDAATEHEVAPDGATPSRPRPSRIDHLDASPEERAQLKELLAQLTGKPTNLPPQATSFVGRVAELADLHQAIRHGARLITLVGPGGSGKSRLAHQLGRQLVSHYQAVEAGRRRGGVWWVDLSGARDLDGLTAAVSRALGIPLAPGDVVKQLGHALSARGESLLVLDGFERLLALAETTVGAWIGAAAQLRVVLTSRELLRLPGESVFEVPPLRLPKTGDGAAVEAVQLFVERAQLVSSGWAPSPEDLTAIAQLVRRLDGLPLAIELAAGRMGALQPSELLRRLDERFSLLVPETQSSTTRGTLRGTIDWSWEQLGADEASALAQLSVFRGGFDLRGATAVVRLETGRPVTEVVEALRRKSLVRVTYPTGDEREPRHGLFESVREYAAEKLVTQRGQDDALARHAAHTLELGRALASGAEGSKSQLDHLELERENLLAVLERNPRPDDAVTVALSLDPLFTIRGPFAVHQAILDRALEKANHPAGRALLLEARARARVGRGRIVESEVDLLEAESLAVQLQDASLRARLRYLLGVVDRLRGQRENASARLEHAIAELRDLGDLRTSARALSNYAVLQTDLGDVNQALDSYNLALELHREVGDRRYEGITLANLGVQQQAVGLLKPARANYQAALGIHRELGNRRSEGISRLNLGDLAAELEQPGQALAHYDAALEIVREVGARRFEGIVLFSQAALHLQYGEYEDAERKCTEAIAVLREVSEQKYLGLALAIEGAIAALQGRLEEGEARLAEGGRILVEVNDGSFLDALELYRAHLEFARALETSSTHQAKVLRATVDRRLASATQPGPSSEVHPAGSNSAADRSEHVRAALRSLRGALTDHTEHTSRG